MSKIRKIGEMSLPGFGTLSQKGVTNIAHLVNKYTEQTYFHIQMSAITYYQTQLCKVFFISIFIAVIKSHLMLYIFQFDTQF